MGLKCDSCVIGCSVIHKPNGQCKRSQQRRYVLRDDLPPALVEAGLPFRKSGTRPCSELHARIELVCELLVELMQSHRNKISKYLVLEFSQYPMGCFVFHMKTVKPSMFGKTTITEQSSSKNRSLPFSELFNRPRTSLGVVLFHTPTLAKACDRRFADTAGLGTGITPGED
jgi:hypothetical protein